MSPAAGKTGTSHDAWFAGYTSNLLCIVWVGYDDYSDLRLSGAQTAAPIWADFMKKAVQLPEYRDVTGFSQPEGVVTRSSDFMDTRLSFTCTHEDLFREPTVLPSAPGFRCGRPGQLGILFFENYDTRFSGYETLSHLALYKHYNVEHWDIEAGLVVRVNELAEDNIRLSDGGSYIRTAYWLDPRRVRPTRPRS
jgi:membrane peptidoglycan carboxypeptidase